MRKKLSLHDRIEILKTEKEKKWISYTNLCINFYLKYDLRMKFVVQYKEMTPEGVLTSFAFYDLNRTNAAHER